MPQQRSKFVSMRSSTSRRQSRFAFASETQQRSRLLLFSILSQLSRASGSQKRFRESGTFEHSTAQVVSGRCRIFDDSSYATFMQKPACRLNLSQIEMPEIAQLESSLPVSAEAQPGPLAVA